MAAGKLPDREKALENALAQIDKQYGKGSVMRLGDDQHQAVAAMSLLRPHYVPGNQSGQELIVPGHPGSLQDEYGGEL